MKLLKWFYFQLSNSTLHFWLIAEVLNLFLINAPNFKLAKIWELEFCLLSKEVFIFCIKAFI